ncbi:MAG: hypothetical protein WBL61_23850 [Bryobacteraceae bacterium]
MSIGAGGRSPAAVRKRSVKPKQTVVAVFTDEGTITITDQYSPKHSPSSR